MESTPRLRPLTIQSFTTQSLFHNSHLACNATPTTVKREILGPSLSGRVGGLGVAADRSVYSISARTALGVLDASRNIARKSDARWLGTRLQKQI